MRHPGPSQNDEVQLCIQQQEWSWKDKLVDEGSMRVAVKRMMRWMRPCEVRGMMPVGYVRAYVEHSVAH